MLIYVTTPEKQNYIHQAAAAAKQNVLDAIVSQQFYFSEYVKHTEQIELANIFILDLDGVQDEEEALLQAVQQFRMLYTVQMIVIAAGRTPGDRLLDAIFCSGIYDIVTGTEDSLQAEVKSCIEKGMTYKDALKFKLKDKEEKKTADKVLLPRPIIEKKETVIVKSRMPKEAKREMVGFAGTQSRIGVTHSCLMNAMYLKQQGFSVALIEYAKAGKAFAQIQKAYGAPQKEGCFTLLDLDFYPEFDLKKLSLLKYQFLIIDFGTYDSKIENDWLRCGCPCLAAGAKPWEMEETYRVLQKIPEEFQKEIRYLFPFVAEHQQNDLRNSMRPLENVLFLPYLADPFDIRPKETGLWRQLFQDYLHEEKKEEKVKWAFFPFGRKK